MARHRTALASAVASLAVALGAAASLLAAQAPAGRPAVLVAAGVGGQSDGDGDLGAPGLHGAFGLAWGAGRALGGRVEAQAFGYGSQSLPAVVGARGSAERVAALGAALTWAPSPRVPLYVLGGAAFASAQVTGVAGRTGTGAAVAGLGVPLGRRLALETQYLRAARALGNTRSGVAARVALRF